MTDTKLSEKKSVSFLLKNPEFLQTLRLYLEVDNSKPYANMVYEIFETIDTSKLPYKFESLEDIFNFINTIISDFINYGPNNFINEPTRCPFKHSGLEESITEYKKVWDIIKKYGY